MKHASPVAIHRPPLRAGLPSRLKGSTFLLFICILTSAATLTAQDFGWEPMNEGLSGGGVWSIAFDNNGNPLAGTGAGIYKGERDGASGSYRWRLTGADIAYADIERAPLGTLFARTWQGIFRSSSNGESWDLAIADSAALFTVISDVMVAWCDPSQQTVYLTRDGGATTTAIWTAPYLEASVQQLESSPDGTIYILATRGSDLFTSTDIGETWEQHATHLFGSAYIEPIGGDTLLYSGGDGIRRSIDGGATWEQIGVASIGRVHAGEDGTMYGFGYIRPTDALLYAGKPLVRSTDRGATWMQQGVYFSEPNPIPQRYPFSVDPEGRLWEGAYNGISMSTDGGRTWHESDRGIHAARIRSFFYREETDALYAVADRWEGIRWPGIQNPYRDKLYRRSSDGSAWIPLADSIPKVFGLDGSGNFYAFVDSTEPNSTDGVPEGVRVSSDEGATWRRIADASARDWTTSSNTVGVTVVWEEQPFYKYKPLAGEMLLTTDGGSTWRSGDEWLPDELDRISFPRVLESGEILISEFSDSDDSDGTDDRFWRYDPSSETLTLIADMDITGIEDGPNGLLYAYGRKHIVRSEDNGRTWDPIPTPTETNRRSVAGLRISPADVLYLAFTPQVNMDTTYRSGDLGRTWSPVTVDLAGVSFTGANHYAQVPAILGEKGWLLDTMRYAPESKYDGSEAAETAVGLYFSGDYGIDWTKVEGFPVGVDITALIMTPDRSLYVGTQDHGVFRLQGTLSAPVDGPVTGMNNGMNVTATPMPASDRTEIGFDLDVAGDVRLELFDLLGEPVRMIERTGMETGRHRLSVDLEGLAAGPYLVRITTGSQRREAVPLIVR